MTRTNPDQLRYLRHRLLGSMALKIAIFSIVFFGALFIFDRFFVSDLGSWIADQTSEWMIYPPGSINDESVLQNILESDEGAVWDIQTNPFDGSLWIRDKRIYQILHDLWLPAAIAMYAIGCLIIVVFTLRRSLAYFDELESAVSDLVTDKEHPVQLSPDLAITEANLNAVRVRALEAEQASTAAEERKNQLIAYLAHDIRTPLTSVIGYLHLLRADDGLSTATRAHYLDVATTKAESLDNLTSELFEIARFNVSDANLDREEVDLYLLCLQVAEELYPQARKREIVLQVECAQEKGDQTDDTQTHNRACPARSEVTHVFVDGPKIARAITNIVRNAITYGDAGSVVEIECYRITDGASYITITNHGPTIAPENLERIFDQFYREDAARTARKGGAGLGLAIAHEIIEAHGGTINVSSVNHTTTFTITL